VDEAIREHQEALKLQPRFAVAHNNLGLALVQKGSLDEAIAHYQGALQLDPDYADAYNNLGTALVLKGRMAEALARFQKALALAPTNPNVQNNLALFLVTSAEPSQRDAARAIQLARQANGLTGAQNPLYLRTLAVALAAGGQFNQAAQTAQRGWKEPGVAELVATQVQLLSKAPRLEDFSSTNWEPCRDVADRGRAQRRGADRDKVSRGIQRLGAVVIDASA
jgi:tetratricopeptide (TPR) repeat protein